VDCVCSWRPAENSRGATPNTLWSPWLKAFAIGQEQLAGFEEVRNNPLSSVREELFITHSLRSRSTQFKAVRAVNNFEIVYILILYNN
jgi:hypothetical protein